MTISSRTIPRRNALTAAAETQETEAVTAAGEEIVWAPEDGFYDLMADIASSLNPPNSECGRYYVADIATTLDRCIICDWEANESWVVPFAIEGDDVRLAPSAEWIPAETAWVRTEDGQAASREKVLALVAGASLEIPAPADVRPDDNPAAEVELPEQQTNASQIKWQAVLLVEDAMTEDGRYITPGATSWRELPLTLMVMTETSDQGHNGAYIGGRIDNIWREGNLVMGSGVFNDDEDGQRAAKLVADRSLTGNSVDLAVREFELAPRSDFDEAGHRIGTSDEEVDPLEAIFGGDDMVFVFTDCVIGMSTVCPFPAFAGAEISVTASALQWRATRQSGMILTASAATTNEEPDPEDEREGTETLTAAVAGLAPLKPPSAWFRNPELTEPTAISVTEEGRIFGHAATWDVCHIGIPDVCTTAPASESGYAYFHLGEIETEEGETLSVGKITLGTGHAAKHLRRQAAAEHYDDTGTAVCDVIVGEDEHGIWVAGALRPDLPAERVRDLRASSLSGDWRDANGRLELVALLAVNVPGFPVPRAARALVAAGETGPKVLTLVAAGIFDRAELTDGDLREFAVLAAEVDGLEGLAELADRED